MQALLGVEGLVSMIEEKVNGLTRRRLAALGGFELPGGGRSVDPRAGTEHLLAVTVKPVWREVLRRLAREMDEVGLEYKVSGGASVALHGVWQAVKDLDLEMSAEGAYTFEKDSGNMPPSR